MGIGIGIVLLAVGLVLALAIGGDLGGVDLELIGWILTGVGGLALVVALILTAQRSHQTIEHVNVARNETPTPPPAGGTGTSTTGSGSSRTGGGSA